MGSRDLFGISMHTTDTQDVIDQVTELLQVMFVDDNEDFLSALKLSFAHNLRSLSFSDPLAALNYLRDCRTQDVPTVLVVDYSMPQLNGIELCQQLTGYPMRKILLTGQVVTAEVIEAFDNQVIDGYISKGEGDFLSLLRSAIIK